MDSGSETTSVKQGGTVNMITTGKMIMLAIVMGAALPVLAADKDVVDIKEGMVVRGATELPKLLYIVPWRKSGVGDILLQPGTSIFGDELAPIDREVFQRQVHYHEMLQTRELAQRR